MAQPTEFDGQNLVYKKPQDMTDEECGPLPTLKQDGHNISCWKLDPQELAEMNRTGVIWLDVLGKGMPPVIVAGIRPFVIDKEESPMKPVPTIHYSDGMDIVGKKGELFFNKSIVPLPVLCKSFLPHQLSVAEDFTSSIQWEFASPSSYISHRLRRYKEIKTIRIVHGGTEIEVLPEWLHASTEEREKHSKPFLQTSFTVKGEIQTKIG